MPTVFRRATSYFVHKESGWLILILKKYSKINKTQHIYNAVRLRFPPVAVAGNVRVNK